MEIKFVTDNSVKMPMIKPGKVTEIRVATGLPKDSQPNAAKERVSVKSKGGYRPQQQKSNVKAYQPPPSNNVSTDNLAKSADALAVSKKKPPPLPPAKKLPTCIALFDYEGQEADELTFKVGDVITILSKEDEGWWTGNLRGKKGLFPSNYVS